MGTRGRQRIVSALLVVLLTFAWLCFNAFAWRASTVFWAASGAATVWFSAKASEWLVRG